MDRLWIYMLCYNEEMLLPFTLDYYSPIAEKIFVYDNMSTDSSVEICRQYPNVEVERFDTDGFVKDSVFLKIKNNEWKKARGKARYVAVLDTDEIVYYREGLRVLLDRAAEANAAIIRQDVAYTVYSAHQVKPADDFSLVPGNTSLLCGPSGGKLSLFSPELKEINYKPGAHRQKPKGRNLSEFSGEVWFHYSHVFGAEIMAKRYEDRISRLSPENRKNEWGIHYRLKYDDLLMQMNEGVRPLSDVL